MYHGERFFDDSADARQCEELAGGQDPVAVPGPEVAIGFDEGYDDPEPSSDDQEDHSATLGSAAIAIPESRGHDPDEDDESLDPRQAPEHDDGHDTDATEQAETPGAGGGDVPGGPRSSVKRKAGSQWPKLIPWSAQGKFC
jgi:hypothetical protein